MQSEKCPCCPNHCEKDNLSCGRGEDYFNNNHHNEHHEEEPKSIEEQVIKDLRKCGHMLYHNRNLNTYDLLKDFSKEELEQLHMLLTKFVRIKNNK